MTTEPRFKPPSTAQISGNVARLVAMAAIVLAGAMSFANPVRAQGGGDEDGNAEVLTRGPVHEAFATVVDYNPGRGFVSRKRPPDPIEELPPEEKPAGEDVTWIPGYWAWDDDASDYIWVSGTWRVPPPGREWIPGYWADSDGEFIWISGYWGEINVRETTYLPPPPESLESGPNVDRPSLDYGWTPGCWIWSSGRYAWRPGYWERGRGDWVWIPSYYVWTPHGYIFIDGYWDYVITRRGIVYAPVHFRSRVYARGDYFYSPRIVFNLGIFSDHLFLRPRRCHYYFGDYYASRYEDEGFFFTFSYYYSWRGYDPFYSHWCWENRRERDWESRYQASYRYRRENVAARPPGTWSAQLAVATSTTSTTQSRIFVAGTTTQLSSQRDFSVRFTKVKENERRNFANRGHELRASREQRHTLEARASKATGRTTDTISEPTRLERPKSPIAARRSTGTLGPPRAPKEPKPDPTVRPASATASAKRDAGSPGRAVQSQGNGPARSLPPGAERAQARKNDGNVKEPDDAQRRARDMQHERKTETDRKSDKEAEARARNESRAQAQRESAERERADRARSQQQAKERAAEAQKKKELQAAESRAKEAEARARNDAQVREKREAGQRAKAAEAKAKAEANQRAKEDRAQKAKGSQKQEKGKSNEDEENASKKGQGNGRP